MLHREITPGFLENGSEEFDLINSLRLHHAGRSTFAAHAYFETRLGKQNYLCQFTKAISFVNIDVLNINPYYSMHLLHIINRSNKSIFQNNRPYYVDLFSNPTQVVYAVLSEFVIKSSSYADHSGQRYLNVINSGEENGHGNFGQTFNILKRFKINERVTNMSKIFVELKSQYIIKQFSDSVTWNNVSDEASFTYLSSHLKPEKPIVGNGYYFLLMRKMPGQTLDSLLGAVKLGQLHLSLSHYISITKGLLKAIKNQVHRHSFCHLDIKESNIMVQLIGEKAEVNLVDFGAAAEWNDQHQVANTSYHLPTELRARYVDYIHPAMDIYSAGLQVAVLFGAPPSQYKPESRWKAYESGICLQGLFADPVFTVLSDSQQHKLRQLISKMTHHNPMKRPLIHDSLRLFKRAVRSEKPTTNIQLKASV